MQRHSRVWASLYLISAAGFALDLLTHTRWLTPLLMALELVLSGLWPWHPAVGAPSLVPRILTLVLAVFLVTFTLACRRTPPARVLVQGALRIAAVLHCHRQPTARYMGRRVVGCP